MSLIPNQRHPTPVAANEAANKAYGDSVGGSPLWTFVDEIIVGSNITVVSFGSGGDGELGTVLDGDADELYMLESLWIPSSGSAVNLCLEPNGITTNQESTWLYSTGSAPSSNESTSCLVIARTHNTSCDIMFSEMLIRAKTGVARHMTVFETSTRSSTDLSQRIHGETWNDNSTNITSLDIRCTTSSGILAGSGFKLYKRVTP